MYHVEDKINEIMDEINNGTYFEGHNLENKSRMVGSFDVDNNWSVLSEIKASAVCTYKDEHFGDFSEWRTVLKLNGVKANTSYYAFINETYIKPEPKKTNYRTDDIVYKFDPTLGANALLRDYAPKMKNPEATIGYTISAGSEVTSDYDGKISSNISTSYSTLVSSPKIYDNGNMMNNYAELTFDYLNPFDNSGQFYEYNISQSYQSSSFIIKTGISQQDIICQDDRTVSIQRDGFWSNLLVHFNLNSKTTIVR